MHDRSWPIGAGCDGYICTPHEVEDAERVGRGLHERLVSVHDRDAEQVELRSLFHEHHLLLMRGIAKRVDQADGNRLGAGRLRAANGLPDTVGIDGTGRPDLAVKRLDFLFETRALAEVYALMTWYHEDWADEATMPSKAYAAWLAWYHTTPDTPCIAICSTSQGDAQGDQGGGDGAVDEGRREVHAFFLP